MITAPNLTRGKRLAKILKDLLLFSQNIIRRPPLKHYQIGPAQALINAILNKKGLEFLWIFPRQSGKDEAIAQTCANLLTLLQRTEASIVHVYPTGQQLSVGVARLENRLDNPLTKSQVWAKGLPIRRGVGKASITFCSAGSKIEGVTANTLLIINEAQDQEEQIISPSKP